MTRRDFIYWLQGYFELSDLTCPLVKLTPSQFECVCNHAALVYRTEGVPYGEALPNPGRDTEVFDWLTYFYPLTGISERATHELRRRLGAAFKHVIDPLAGPAMQKDLNDIHGNDEEVMRC